MAAGSPDLPQALRTAHEEAVAFAQPRLEEVRQRLDAQRPDLTRMVEAAQDGTSPRETRMARLRELAEHLNQAAQSMSACATSHCSHCCYTPVSLSALEARLIGEAIGVAPAMAPSRMAAGSDVVPVAASRPGVGYSYAWPCPFLVEDEHLPSGSGGRCAVYAHRPMVCRGCLSMAPSDTLCELRPGHLVPIPMFDARGLHVLSAQIGGMEVADIRDFFPSGLAAA